MASKANMTMAERRHEEIWKNYNNYYSTLDYARKEGQKEGILSTVQKLKSAGTSVKSSCRPPVYPLKTSKHSDYTL